MRPWGLRGPDVALIVKARAAQAGLDPAEFSGHSLPAGFATSAAETGASILKIMETTRYKSVDVLAACWIRPTLRLYLENRAIVRPTVVTDPKQITGVVAHQLANRRVPVSKSVEVVQHRFGPCRLPRCGWTKHERQSVSVRSAPRGGPIEVSRAVSDQTALRS